MIANNSAVCAFGPSTSWATAILADAYHFKRSERRRHSHRKLQNFTALRTSLDLVCTLTHCIALRIATSMSSYETCIKLNAYVNAARRSGRPRCSVCD